MMRAFGDRLGSDWCVGVAGGFNCGCAWSGRIFLSALALGYSSSSKKGDQGLPWGCYPKRDKTPSKTAVAAISLGDVLSVRLICLCGDFEFAGCVVQLLILLFPACHGVGAPPLGG